MCADLDAGMQALMVPSAAASSVLSGLLSGCTRAALLPATASATAWALWRHAVAVGLVLDCSAQEALWQSQSGDYSTAVLEHSCLQGSAALHADVAQQARPGMTSAVI